VAGVNVSRPQLEAMIQDALDRIPKYFQKKIENLEFTLEQEPDSEIRRSLGLRSDELLLGLYQGVPRTQRSAGYGNVLPDKITLYQRSLAEYCPDEKALRNEVYEVLVHEIGHYFGLSEGQLRALRPPHAYKVRGRKP
jgi:predicted Zn-dependent protease with MMP-like domain